MKKYSWLIIGGVMMIGNLARAPFFMTGKNTFGLVLLTSFGVPYASAEYLAIAILHPIFLIGLVILVIGLFKIAGKGTNVDKEKYGKTESDTKDHTRTKNFVDSVCNWSGKPVKGYSFPMDTYVLETNNIRIHKDVIGFMCPSCNVVSVTGIESSGIMSSFLHGYDKSKCGKCGEKIPKPTIIVPESKFK